MYLKSTIPGQDTVLAAVNAIQTFVDFLGFNPHCHILLTNGCFCATGAFQVSPVGVRKDLEETFRHKVFKMLLSEGKITEDLVRMLMSWRHSGFNVFSGPRIYPREETAMENLVRYVIRACCSRERMNYVEEDGTAVYRSKDGAEQKVFDALECLVPTCRDVPTSPIRESSGPLL